METDSGGVRVSNGRGAPLEPHELEGAELEMAVGIVPVSILTSVWPKVCHWIDAALQTSAQHEYTPGIVYRELELGRMMLLAVHEPVSGRVHGAAVIARGTSHHGEYIGLVCCGGEGVTSWLHLMVESVKRIARESRAKRIVILGRPGWQKLLEEHGTRVHSLILVCDELGD